MSGLLILMYHALYEDEQERDSIPDDERPYAVATAEFSRHLDAIRETGSALVVDPAEWQPEAGPAVMLTFDDGHLSDYTHAFRILRERRLAATFFVTSGFMKSRSAYCKPWHLREMASGGMCIGSHGETHRFLSDLPDPQAAEELRVSKQDLEEATGQAVTAVSFPGGRGNRRTVRLASAAGYVTCYSSEVGVNSSRPEPGGVPLRRIPVRGGMPSDHIRKLVRQEPGLLRQAILKDRLKTGLRTVVGSAAYHAFYTRFYKGRESTDAISAKLQK